MTEKLANTISPEMAIAQMISSYWVSQCIYVAAKLGIADLLKDGAKHCDALATATNTHSDSLYRVLRALSSVGIFVETEPRYFQLTPLATVLQNDVPNSLKAFVLMLGEEHYQAWGNLLDSIRTGECAFEQKYGMNIFEYYLQNPTSGKIFEDAMTNFSTIENVAVIEAYDFSKINTLVDVGGGYGSLLVSILHQYPTLQGILFDETFVIEQAEAFFQQQEIRDRTSRIGGNFFETIPSGGDAYLLKHIIHDWDDSRAIAILQNCHKAINPGGKILVIEQVIPPGNEPFGGKFLDINMLVMSPGGRERTQAEYQELFKQSGFQLTQIIPTSQDISIVEGIKVNS